MPIPDRNHLSHLLYDFGPATVLSAMSEILSADADKAHGEGDQRLASALRGMSEVMHAAALECFFIDFAPRARSDTSTDDDNTQS